LLILFTTAFFSTVLLTGWARKIAKHFTNAYPQDALQRFHVGDVSRLGGIAMFVGFVLSIACAILLERFSSKRLNLGFGTTDTVVYIAYLTLPVFIGMWEDITFRVRVSVRLLTTLIGAFVAAWLLDAAVTRLGIPWIDIWWPHYPALGIGLAVLAMSGLPHAFNIIDGYNGLAGSVSVIICGALFYVSYLLGDRQLAAYALCTIAVTCGFLIWNYPRGLIFAGDSGAYFWGLNIAIICILLVDRHPQVSPWFVMLLLIYPVWETLFSSYRKISQGSAPSVADSLHLHHVIYKRVVRSTFQADEAKMLLSRNNRTTPYLIGLTVMTVLPAVIFWDQTLVLMAFTALFVVSYLAAYALLVDPRLRRWLRKFRHARIGR